MNREFRTESVSGGVWIREMAGQNSRRVDPERLLAEEPFMRALVRNLFEDEVDDAVQQAYLQALKRSRTVNNPRRWLARTVRNVVNNMRRSARRRRAHETAAADRDLHVPSSSELMEREEYRRSLVRAVDELPGPLRTIVLLRYFEDVPPRMIAKNLELPVATVSNRLRKARELLRKRLDAEYGHTPAWLVPLAPLAVARPTMPASPLTAPTSAISGAFAMMTKLKAAGIAAVLITGAAAWFWTLPSSPASPSLPEASGARPLLSSRVAGPSPDRDALLNQEPGDNRASSQERSPVAADVVIRGRTVDARTGVRLAGGRVGGTGWDGQDRRGAAGPSRWSTDTITTDADGAFELRFASRPGHRFRLGLSGADRVSMSRRWEELAPGTVDLGDLPMVRGAAVMGVVVDEAGEPVVGARLQFNGGLRPDGPEGFSHRLGYISDPTGEDGDFTTPGTFLPGGDYFVMLDAAGHELIRPNSLVVPEADSSVTLNVFVRNLGNLPTLSGVVVDEYGVPAEGVELVTAVGSVTHNQNRGQSAEDGTFMIRKREGDDRPVRIEQHYLGSYVVIPDGQEFPWGTEDIRVVARRPQSVRVRVVEAVTGRPVEDYALRILPRDGTISSSDDAPRTSGHHDGGSSVVEGIRKGRHVAVAFPDDDSLLPSRGLLFQVGDQGADLRIEVERRRPLTVQLVRADGSPVPRSQVQLLRREAGDGELDLETRSGPPEEVFGGTTTSRLTGVVLDNALTNAEGRVVLRGPASRGDLAVKALGPGHMPLIRNGVDLLETSPVLVVQVTSGAALSGTVSPAAARDRLASSPGTFRQRPFLRLRRTDSRVQFPTRGNIPIEDDGSFTLDGIPPGDWTLSLHHFVQRGAGTFVSRARELQAVTLRDDQSLSLEVDLSFLLPGTISGQVFLDGMVYANREIALQGVERNASGRLMVRSSVSASTDSEGRFTQEMVSGTFRLSLMPEGIGDSEASIADTTMIGLQPEQVVERVFRVVRRTLRVRFLESNGDPAVDRFITASTSRLRELRTDPDGWVVLDPAPLDPVTFHTWPQGKSEADIARETGQDRGAANRMRITLGPVQMPPGQKEAELTLRLPPGRE